VFLPIVELLAAPMGKPTRIYLIINEPVEAEPLGDLSSLEVEILSTMSEKALDRLLDYLLDSGC
jgi:hypothetical protein